MDDNRIKCKTIGYSILLYFLIYSSRSLVEEKTKMRIQNNNEVSY